MTNVYASERLFFSTVVALVFSTSTLVGCAPARIIPVEERQTIRSNPVLVSSANASESGRSSKSAPNNQYRTGKSNTHHVKAGDTVYSIAFVNRISVDDLMAWNDISDSRRLRVGQNLTLEQPAGFRPKATPQARVETIQPAVTQGSLPNSHKDQAANTEIVWHWPVRGNVIERFSSAQRQQGIIIAAPRLSSVKPAAPGRVVYTGSALKGYGNMIIINHAQNYLSAYAHTGEILVKEGQTVTHADVIARVGKDGSSRDALHFQIRLGGNPIDPLSLLNN